MPLEKTLRGVHVWIVSLASNANPLFYGVLSKNETEKASRLAFEIDRQRYIAAHCALRTLLSRYAAVSPASLEFDTNGNGKPYLIAPENARALSFNLSHSGEWALVAVCGAGDVGVDIERVRDNIEFRNIARRYFTPAECAWMESRESQKQLHAFFRLWTIKEAYLKALGTGLSKPLNEIEVRFETNGRLAFRFNGESQDEPWFAQEMEVVEGYTAAVVTRNVPETVAVRMFTEDGQATST